MICLIFLGVPIGIWLIFFEPGKIGKFSFGGRLNKEATKSRAIFKGGSQVYEAEAITVINELMNSYKLNQHNLTEAINHAIGNLDDAPKTQRLLISLATALNQSQGQGKVEEEIKAFEKSIGSSWGENLGEIIYCGHVMGLDVERALSDLLDRVKKGKVLQEYNKRNNNEARLMIKWLTPISYVATVLIATQFFNLSVGDFMANQFGTSLGLWWMGIILVLYAFSIGVYYAFAKRGTDI